MDKDNQKPALVHVEHFEEVFSGAEKGILKAVDDVSFVRQLCTQGETLGLVGESGCGRRPADGLVVKLYPATSGTLSPSLTVEM